MHPRGSRDLAPMRLRGALAPLLRYRFSAREPLSNGGAMDTGFKPMFWHMLKEARWNGAARKVQKGQRSSRPHSSRIRTSRDDAIMRKGGTVSDVFLWPYRACTN